MNSKLRKAYDHERALGWRAQQALRNARIRLAWDKQDGWQSDDSDDSDCAPYERGSGYGPVRLRLVPHDSACLDDLLGDGLSERERKAQTERCNHAGVWGLIGEYWDGAEWQHADSCYGFVGDDWSDSGYDTDIMSATLGAYVARIMEYASELEASRPDMYGNR